MLETAAETRNGASKTTSKIDDENQIEKQFLSSQIFHRTPGGCVRRITVEKRFELDNLESFDLVTQELYRESLARNFTQSRMTKQLTNILSST
jgi:hypothetical protein